MMIEHFQKNCSDPVWKQRQRFFCILPSPGTVDVLSSGNRCDQEKIH